MWLVTSAQDLDLLKHYKCDDGQSEIQYVSWLNNIEGEVQP